MTKTGDSSYQDHPELTRYVSSARYEKPKEDFKLIAGKLEALLEPQRCYEVADVGCGNGELLYYLHRQLPHLELHGFDHTPEFIETAKGFPGLKAVKFFNQDLFDIQGSFDVVLTTCLLSLFRDIEPPLEKLLGLCRKDGYVLATGLFNPFDIDVRVEFRDNTREETRGKWRSDFNRHSQQSIRGMLAGRAGSVSFEECAYDIEIPRDPNHPIRVWTFKDDEGRTLLINGAQQLANQTLLIIQK